MKNRNMSLFKINIVLVFLLMILALTGCSSNTKKESLNDISKVEILDSGESLVVDNNSTNLNFLDASKKIVKTIDVTKKIGKEKIALNKIIDIYKNEDSFFVYAVAYNPNTTLVSKNVILKYSNNGSNMSIIYEEDLEESTAFPLICDVSIFENNAYIVKKDITNPYKEPLNIIVSKIDLSKTINENQKNEIKKAEVIVSQNNITYPSVIRYLPQYETLFYNDVLGDLYNTRDNINYYIEILDRVKDFNLIDINSLVYSSLNDNKLFVDENQIDENILPIDINVNSSNIICVDSLTDSIYTYDKINFKKEVYLNGDNKKIVNQENIQNKEKNNDSYIKYFKETLHNVLEPTMFNRDNTYKAPIDLEEYSGYNTIFAPFILNVKDKERNYRILVINRFNDSNEIIYDSKYEYLVGEIVENIDFNNLNNIIIDN